MKIFKLSALFAMLAFVALSFTACEDDTTDPVVTTTIPAAPSALKAVSLSATEVGLSWTASTHADSTWFSGYELSISGGTTPITIAKTATSYTVSGLVEGTEYTFTLKSKNTAGEYSTTSVTVKWAPATRFVKNGNDDVIKVYETASSFGSGLTLYTTAAGAPMCYKTSSTVAWDLGLKTSTGIIFGSASKLGYTTLATTPNTAQISDYALVSSLNNDYANADLSTKTFSEKTLDLSNVTGNVVVYARVQNGNTYNYARIFIKAGTTGLLQGTGSDRYLEMEISYQKVAGSAYAK